MRDGRAESLGAAFTALAAGSATLVCCVLPAVPLSFGAGAAVVGLVTAFPQLVWLSDHKLAVFGIAAAFLALAGTLLWHARRLPCPAEPADARRCMRLRRMSAWLYVASLGLYALGAAFAYLLPRP